MDGLLALTCGGPASYPHLYSSGTSSSPSLLVLCAIRSTICQSKLTQSTDLKIYSIYPGPQCYRNDSCFWSAISAPPFPSTSSTLPNMRIFNSLQIRLLLPLLVLVNVHAERDYTIKNKCPVAVDLYINGRSVGPIARNADIHKSFAEDCQSGLIYTTTNGGRTNGKRTTRAGFYGAVSMFPFVCILPLSTCPCFYQDDYYYIVKDSEHHNVGVRIVPKPPK